MTAAEYANSNLNILFTGTNDDGSNNWVLDGQCVSLAKHFIGDTWRVKDWYISRGHAKDFGDTLVAQGIA